MKNQVNVFVTSYGEKRTNSEMVDRVLYNALKKTTELERSSMKLIRANENWREMAEFKNIEKALNKLEWVIKRYSVYGQYMHGDYYMELA